MASDRVDDVWLRLKDKTGFIRADFLLRLDELAKQFKITREAAAYILAREQGIDIAELLTPAKIGRVFDISSVKTSGVGDEASPYILFTLVNEEERLLGCAFGDRVDEIKDLEDRAVEITGYNMARSTRRRMLTVAESSKVRALEDVSLPPIWKLKPARVASLKDMERSSWTWIVEAVVVYEEITEYNSCPTCRRSVMPKDGCWECRVHGLVDAVVKKVLHLRVADPSGIYPAVYFGEPLGESLFKRKIVAKGYFREGELQVSRIYEPKAAVKAQST